MKQSRLPFKITLDSLETFTVLEDGYNYSYAGIKINFTRNKLGVLAGGFYLPTLIFSLLTLLSFAINPDVVGFFLKHLIQIGTNTFLT